MTSELFRALNRLAKWRAHFAGWQLGTRPSHDPECQAIRDHREATILLRAESTALVGLLLSKGIITQEEWESALTKEADLLSMAFEDRWPGARATDEGMTYDVTRALAWMQGWKP